MAHTAYPLWKKEDLKKLSIRDDGPGTMSNKSQTIKSVFEHTAQKWSEQAGHAKLMIACAADRCLEWGDAKKSFYHPKLEYDYDHNRCFECTPVIQDVLQPLTETDGKRKKRIRKYLGKIEMGDVSAEVKQSSININCRISNFFRH